MDDKTDRLSNILKQGTAHKAPEGMAERVFSAWEAEKAPAIKFAPIIPTWVWWVVSAAIAIVAGGSLFGSSTSSSSKQYSIPYLKGLVIAPQNWVPTMDPIMVAGLLVFGIMMFVIAGRNELYLPSLGNPTR